MSGQSLKCSSWGIEEFVESVNLQDIACMASEVSSVLREEQQKINNQSGWVEELFQENPATKNRP